MYGARSVGERSFSFHRPDRAFGERRDIATFNEGERAAWYGGQWRHGYHDGRLGHWWEVNGAWYLYDQPMDGPPAYVSDVEALDDPTADPYDDPSVPVVAGPPIPIEAPEPIVEQAPPPAVMFEPAPVYVPAPAICVGPICLR